MSNGSIPEIAGVKRLTARQWAMLCLAASALIPSIGHAQLTAAAATTTTLMAVESGAHWVAEGAETTATVTAGRTATALASARIELRDLAGRLVAGTTAPLGPATPAQLRFQNKVGGGPLQLSLYVKVTGLADAGIAPIASWEDISPAGSITVGGSCGPAGHGGGGMYMCEGFRDFTIPAPLPPQ